MPARPSLILGSRGSDLALWQTTWVRDRIVAAHPDVAVEIKVIKTIGDVNLETPLAEIGDKGLFTKELEHALLSGTIDAAVHSLKDMPTNLPEGLLLGAISEREDVRDAFVRHPESTLRSITDVPQGGTVATGSLRRRSQLFAWRPDLRIEGLRGNVKTRLDKLAASQWHGVILAAAGLKRLGLESAITEYLSLDIMLPAVGQGAIGVEARSDDSRTLSLLHTIDSPDTRAATLAERAVLRRLEGGCQIPIGAHGSVRDGRLHVRALVAGLDGVRVVRGEIDGNPADCETMGNALAERLLKAGADEILADVRRQS